MKTIFLSYSFAKSRPHTAALADPPEATCSYIDHLSFMCSQKARACGPKHKILPRYDDINPRFSRTK